LAAMRLGAQRSMISLLDGQSQYILAEATPSTSLRRNSRQEKNLDILLGNVRIPRNWGLCELVLDPVALAEGDEGIVIIKDLSTSCCHMDRSYVKDGPQFRFYAGTPIRSPNGTIVGSMCIFDGPERTGMSADDIAYLQDLAATVMEYLVTYTLKDQHRRGAESLQGLLTFVSSDEAPSIQKAIPRRSQLQPTPQSSPERAATNEVRSEKQDSSYDTKNQSDNIPANPIPPHGNTNRLQNSVGDLQDSILPSTTRDVFAKAADIMLSCCDMDGILFIDASVAATTYNGGRTTPTRTR
jgi:GAF domain-containing protein